ncbi:hypothetical protein [Burkholderia sp. Tr-20390]|uniref:hypothetical protein n=1 Tax=Burkholderia sp. Tr-20390 TaxID=2703904 RepID=UPI00197FCAE1|nr:hypothetical protein [Burkholderia sp. Tr-20390]MBN3729441.1 hypothetical protein [Burkholderia sp. Tr-20390]
MNLDYVALRNQIHERFKALSPKSAELTQDDLHKYFRDRLAQRSAASEADAARSARADRIGLAIVSVASIGAVGSVIAAGPIAAPAVGAVTIGAAGYAAARAIVNTVRGLQDRDERFRTGALLKASIDEQRREYARDQSGGFFKRLYIDIADRFKRHDATVEQLIGRIDNLQVPRGETYASAVKKELDRAMTPELVDYVNRTGLDRHSHSAHLLARVSTIADLAGPSGELRLGDTARAARGRTALAAMGIGGSERGVLSSTEGRSAQQLLGMPRAAALNAHATDVTYYGYIRGSEGDREFLESFGIELGPFNGDTFNVKADPEAYQKILSLGGAVGAVEMYPLSEATKAPGAVTAQVDLDKLSVSELSAYGAFVAYATVSDELPSDPVGRSRRASLVASGLAVANEWARRNELELAAPIGDHAAAHRFEM